MPAYRKDDIRIGEDEWIEFADLAGRQDQAHDIDPFLGPIVPFLQRLEAHCVPGCCGLNAFDFTPPAIIEAARGFERIELQHGLSAAITAIEALPAAVVVSRYLNNYIDRATALQLFRHLLNVVTAVAR